MFTSGILRYLTRNLRKINRPIFRSKYILGIETSCDDTGIAVIDTEGNLLGEALHSQHLTHLNNGGIIPPLAADLHRANIEKTVQEAIIRANLSYQDLDAIAVTTRPGLPLSLRVGNKYAKYLCKKYHKPYIPIHHMQAHALVARMTNKSLEFPFLVLLISGGHCLVAIAQSVDSFLLMGESMDDAPGEAFDKMARRLKIKNIPEYSELSGGQAIELAASKADNPEQYTFKVPLLLYKDCNFSMAGVKTQFLRHVQKDEGAFDLEADQVIPDYKNLCAGFLLVITKHLGHRVQRAMEYVAMKNLIPPDKQTLVVSGGAACNNFIAEGLNLICESYDYKLIRPPPKLCTDNGVMIAWNGVERWNANIGIYHENYENMDIEKICPLGKSIIDEVARENISCKWVQMTKLINDIKSRSRSEVSN